MARRISSTRRRVRRPRVTSGVRKRAMKRRNLKRRTNYRLRPNALTLKKGWGLPDVLKIKLKYSVGLRMNTGTPEQHFWFRGNVPYDPDPTTQPGQLSAADYSLLMPIYRYCRCYASKLSYTFSSINTDPTQVTLLPKADEQVFMTKNIAQTDKRHRASRYVNQGGNTSGFVSNFCTTKDIFGLKNPLDDDDHHYDFNNETITSPDNQWFWCLISSNAFNTSGHNIGGQVKITYYCQFFDRIANVGFEEQPEDLPEEPIGATGPSGPPDIDVTD